MFRNLAGNLVLHGRIQTTDAKARELSRIADRLVTRAVRLGDDLTVDIGKIKDEDERQRVVARRVHAQRQVARFLPKHLTRTIDEDTIEDVDIVYRLFHEIAPRYLDRVKNDKGGGYTRIIKLLPRRGDNASMALIEFVGNEDADEVQAEDAEA